ncbi:hypothetical protein [Corynebacterium phoceense]
MSHNSGMALRSTAAFAFSARVRGMPMPTPYGGATLEGYGKKVGDHTAHGRPDVSAASCAPKTVTSQSRKSGFVSAMKSSNSSQS